MRFGQARFFLGLYEFSHIGHRADVKNCPVRLADAAAGFGDPDGFAVSAPQHVDELFYFAVPLQNLAQTFAVARVKIDVTGIGQTILKVLNALIAQYAGQSRIRATHFARVGRFKKSDVGLFKNAFQGLAFR